MKKEQKSWRKPTLKDLSLSMEVSAYRCAEMSVEESKKEEK